MKIKLLLIMSLFLATTSCSKEKMLDPDFNEDWLLNSWGHTTKIETPKGWIDIEEVNKEDLPEWIQNMTEEIICGYVMKAGSVDNILYFIYDYETKYGRFYDANGNTTRDNTKLKDWVVLYIWNKKQYTTYY